MNKVIIAFCLFFFSSFLCAETLITNRGKRLEIHIVKMSNEIVTFTLLNGDKTEYTMSLDAINKIIDNEGKELDCSLLEKQDIESEVDINNQVSNPSENLPHIEMKGTKIYIDGKKIVYENAICSFDEYCLDAYIEANNFNRGRKWNKVSNKLMYYGLYATAGMGVAYLVVGSNKNDPESGETFQSFFSHAAICTGGVVVVGALIKSVCAYHRYSVIKKAVRTYNNKCYQPEIALDAYIAPGQVGIALNF